MHREYECGGGREVLKKISVIHSLCSGRNEQQSPLTNWNSGVIPPIGVRSSQGRFRSSVLHYRPTCFSEDLRPRAISHNSWYLVNLIYYSTIISAWWSIDDQWPSRRNENVPSFSLSLSFLPPSLLSFISPSLRPSFPCHKRFPSLCKANITVPVIC